MNFITIFTPTYNRSYLLTRLYNSLLRQENKNFIWLIVDDGSDDSTEEVVKSWIIEQRINIRYFRQENKGKHIAHNKGVELCDTTLFMCVDSDDFLVDDAIALIYELFINESTDVLGFCMRKGNLNKVPLGRNWPNKIEYAYFSEIYQNFNYIGEIAIIFKTDLIKNYKFPQIVGEKFIPENALYDRINYIAPMKLDNRVCYCFEYMEDGYTNSGLSLYLKNPIGISYSYLVHIKYALTFSEKIKAVSKYLAWKEITQVKIPKELKETIPFYLFALGYMFKNHYIELFNSKIGE